MTKHLFLSGPSGSGKSTAIFRGTRDILCRAGGFGTCRLFDKSGAQRGFRHASAPEYSGVDGEYMPGAPGMFIESGEGFFAFRREVFTGYTLNTLERAGALFYLLDEIGGSELLIPEFADALRRRLAGDTPCVGVWKAAGNSEHMKREMKPGRDYDGAYGAFDTLLRESEKITLVESGDYETFAAAVREWRAANKLY